MPTILTHPAVPLAMTWGLGRGVISKRLLLAGVVASMIPDLDVVAFRLGIPYAAQFGHRGFTHSLLFAFLLALLGVALTRYVRSTPIKVFLFLFIAIASHGLLDTFTNGGLGIALLWPFSDARFFAPLQPIQVSPIGISHVLSSYGLAVFRSELVWVWLPCFTAAAIAVVLRRLFAASPHTIATVVDDRSNS
jgi:inner membrane protein